MTTCVDEQERGRVGPQVLAGAQVAVLVEVQVAVPVELCADVTQPPVRALVQALAAGCGSNDALVEGGRRFVFVPGSAGSIAVAVDAGMLVGIVVVHENTFHAALRSHVGWAADYGREERQWV